MSTFYLGGSMDREFTVERIRKFNRCYTSVLSLLDKSYLNTEYSVVEARILYEIQENRGCTANDILKKIHIDKGYLSRIIKRFEKRGLLTRKAAGEDSRKLLLLLTENGEKETFRLIRMTNERTGNLIQGLSDDECRRLCEAMDAISDIFEGRTEYGDH